MYWTTVESIGIPFLYNAALVCKNRGYNLRSLYVDPDGECAISYWGTFDVPLVASILQNYLPYDAIFEEVVKMIEENPTQYYKYFDEDHTKYPEGCTTIYTPDGIDYRKLEVK